MGQIQFSPRASKNIGDERVSPPNLLETVIIVLLTTNETKKGSKNINEK